MYMYKRNYLIRAVNLNLILLKVRDLITDIGDANVGAIVLDSAAILCGIGTFSSLQCSICNHSQPYNIGEIGLLIAESA